MRALVGLTIGCFLCLGGLGVQLARGGVVLCVCDGAIPPGIKTPCGSCPGKVDLYIGCTVCCDTVAGACLQKDGPGHGPVH